MFLPEPDAPRLAAIVVAPKLQKSDVQNALARCIDPAFMPRPLIVRDALPRDGNGKLAHAALVEVLAEHRAVNARETSQPQTLAHAAKSIMSV